MTSSHRSSSEATTTYRDHSPPAPLSPIAPTSLPRWLRPIRGRGAFIGNSKVRLAFLALACVVLGWKVTSTLGPSDESPEYLTVYDAAIVAYRHFKPHEKLLFRDQGAMDKVMKEPFFAANVVQAPQRWFNAYHGEHNDTLAPFQIPRGDLLVHFAGVPAREQRMGFWLDRAEDHPDDWEVPVKSTSYPQERKDFWDELSRGRQSQKEMAEVREKATQLLDSMQAQLEEYGDRVSVGDKEAIDQQRAAVSRVMGDNELKDNLDRLNEEIGKLEETVKPLARAVKNSHELLLNAAHDAIFAGEKDLLDANYATDPTNRTCKLLRMGLRA
jgi:hypothetical protein